jgi:fructokinase
VSVALARLGVPTTLLARLGHDVFGRQMRAHLVSNGVDPRHLTDADEPSTLAVVSLDDQRRASYDFWLEGAADWQWSPADLEEHPEAGCVAFHTGSLASWTEPGAAALHGLFARARQTGTATLSYDPNVRPGLMGAPATARTEVEQMVGLAHVVKVSEDDLGWLYPGSSAAEVIRGWAEAGPGLVVATLGPNGALAARPGALGVVRTTAPAVALVDTVGAGDTFTAGLLYGLSGHDALGREPLRRLAGLADEDLTDVLAVAARAAALTCTREGCDPPTRDELETRG